MAISEAPAGRTVAAQRQYFYDMDAVRAVLMLLGVPYHVSRIYAGTRPFGIQSDDTSHLLSILCSVLHSFRMEAFFIVAGYFAAMVLSRSAASAFLASRTLRIGVPLLVCTVLFVPLGAALMLSGARHGGAVSAGDVVDMLGRQGDWWVMHLWFLQVLLLQTALLAGAAILIGRLPLAAALVARASAWLSWLTQRRFIIGGTLIALIMVAVWVSPKLLTRFGVNMHPFAPFFDLRLVIRFLPFFVFGIALFAKPDVRTWFNRHEPLSLPLAIGAAALFTIGEHGSRFAGVFLPIGACFAGLFWAQVLISFAARRLTKPNPLVTWLSQSSYTVYLFHYPIVLALGLAFLGVGLPPLVEFAIINVVTLAICFAIYAVIRRSRLLGFLFNGKPLGKSATASL